MKPIYLLCLHSVRTGGPEAIHQLSDALIEQGFDARMVYYDWGHIAELERAVPEGTGYHFGARENPIEEYARYKSNVADAIPNSPDVVVVLPETLCHLAPKFDKATVLIWWLSVDNGFGALSRVNLNHLRRPNVKHAPQSDYASDFLNALQFLRPGDNDEAKLGDYTTDMLDLAHPLPMLQRPLRVTLNATLHKIIADIDAIVSALGPGIECKLIGRSTLSRADIAGLFATSRVYADLGSFPGNDRMPREARMMGCQVITSGSGGATISEEIAKEYDPADVAETIAMYVRDPDPSVAAHKRKSFKEGGMTLSESERSRFFRQVRDIFSEL